MRHCGIIERNIFSWPFVIVMPFLITLLFILIGVLTGKYSYSTDLSLYYKRAERVVISIPALIYVATLVIFSATRELLDTSHRSADV